MPQPKPTPNWQQRFVAAVDCFVYKFSNRWLVIFNTLVGLYVGIPFLAPVFMVLGLTAPAKVIYTMYSPMCHQMGYRSWFLFPLGSSKN